MSAIETIYSGYRFRSRLEARWAVFFDRLELRWIYEPEGFEWDGVGRYLPDFFLPKTVSRNERSGIGAYVEVKPDGYVITPYDHARYERLVIETRKPLMLVRGLPVVDGWADEARDIEEVSGFEYEGKVVAAWDSPMLLIRCHECQATRFEYSEGNYMV